MSDELRKSSYEVVANAPNASLVGAAFLPLKKLPGSYQVMSVICSGNGGGTPYVGDIGDPGDCADCAISALPADCTPYDKPIDQVLDYCELYSCNSGDDGGGGGGDYYGWDDGCGGHG